MTRVEDIRKEVRRHYGERATQQNDCCGETTCCGSASGDSFEKRIEAVEKDLVGPSLGCGSPLAYANVQPGETVVDLGSGAGREALSAATATGPSGLSIGVDMTPEMIWTARANAQQMGVSNAEFRLGEIEHLPVSDARVDVVISNCVINLLPDKVRAFQEAYRILRPGGRLVVSDMIANGTLPESVRSDPTAWVGCIAGAIDLDAYVAAITAAGFQEIEVVEAGNVAPGEVYSATVRARKPSTLASAAQNEPVGGSSPIGGRHGRTGHS